MTKTRQLRKEALSEILLFPSRELETLKDCLMLYLAEARLDMENADDQISIWRVQGRVQALKELINAITPKE